MHTQLAKWGHSLALRIPKALAQQARWSEGQRLELHLGDDGQVVLRPVAKVYSLEELVAGITPENRPEETDWGPAQGKEAW